MTQKHHMMDLMKMMIQKKKQEMDFLKNVIKLSYKNKKQRKVLLSLLFIVYLYSLFLMN